MALDIPSDVTVSSARATGTPQRREDFLASVGSAEGTEGGFDPCRGNRPWLVPVTVDGVEAIRTDQAKDAVYVYCDVDHSYVYFVDGGTTC